MYEHIFQHYVKMTHHSISRGWQVCTQVKLYLKNKCEMDSAEYNKIFTYLNDGTYIKGKIYYVISL